MRRKDREVTDIHEIFKMIDNCPVIHIAMTDNGKPYVVALNFGYERQGDDLILYFHSAYEGRKIDILKKNPEVYFQMECSGRLIAGTSENPCAYAYSYDSVMGSGKVAFIETEEEKIHGLNCLIQHIGKTDENFRFPEAMLSRTCVYCLRSRDFTGKRHE